MCPGQGADQGRLAGAVAADEADDFAGVQVDGHVVDGVQATERHADVAQLDEWDAGRVDRFCCGGGDLAHDDVFLRLSVRARFG